MAFIDEQFPKSISMDAMGGPGFLTNIAVMESGAESRNQNWEFDRAEFEVSHAARLPAQWRPLRAFFMNMRGRANSFRFHDPLDYVAAVGEGLYIDSGADKQMVKRYTFGSTTYDRIITKPVVGSITLVGGGTLDYTTGIVTGGTPTGWSGQFDLHCRFDTDRMRHETIDRNLASGLIVGWQSIPIVEVRE